MKQKREDVRLYAVLAASAGEAVSQVEALAPDGTVVEVAGKLSKRMARSLKIVPGELRVI